MRVAVLSLLVCCSSTDDTDPNEVCTCPAEVCDLEIALPDYCAGRFPDALIFLDGQRIGTVIPSEPFNSCTVTLRTGQTSSIEVRATGFQPPPASVTCGGGVHVSPSWCTLRFSLAESCRGTLDSAEVLVDGEVYGEVHPDEPFVPCVLLESGAEVTGAMRGGDQAFSAPLFCPTATAQPMLVMECPEP